MFCIIALAQSAFNIMLENKDDDSLLPSWAIVLFNRCTGKMQKLVREFNLNIGQESPEDAMKMLSSVETLNESVAGVEERVMSSDKRRPQKSASCGESVPHP